MSVGGAGFTQSDPWSHPDAKRWMKQVRRGLLPKLRESGFTCAIVPEGPDIKMAVEVGFTLLMGKPLLLVVPPGRRVPDGLVRAADAIVEWSDDPAVMARRLKDAIEQVAPS